MSHQGSGTKDNPAFYGTEIVQKTTTEWRFITILSAMLSTIAKSSYVAGETAKSLDDYEETCKELKKNIAFGDSLRRVFAHSSFGLTEENKF